MNQEATYKTAALVRLFSQLEEDGYEAMNLKLITDLIEREAEAPTPINTVGKLKEALEEYSDDTVIFYSLYTKDHAFIEDDLWNGISQELLTNTEFLEDHHEFLNCWFDVAQSKIENLEFRSKN